MLKRFEVENFKNFKDRLIFDLSDTKNYEFNNESVINGIVSKALIYGVNGCGKSNLGEALFDLHLHISDQDITTPSHHNYLNGDSSSTYATFKYIFEFNNTEVIYQYHKLSSTDVIHEELTINNKTVIKYQQNQYLTINLEGAESLITNLKDTKIRASINYVARNAALRTNSTNLAFYAFFSFIHKMRIAREDSSSPARFTQLIAKDNNVDGFQDFLNNAGIICNLQTTKNNDEEDIEFIFKNKTVAFSNAASMGTKALARLYFQLQKIKKNEASFVYLDEFDAFYHHKLATLVVEQLRSVNPQVIMTTHNTGIMVNDLLRPDCYFIMNDGKIQPIHRLTSKEIRHAHNIEKMFRAGSFDG